MNEDKLIKACRTGDLELVKSLVEKDSFISVSDYLPLRHAACRGYLDIVKYLVEKGSDISVYNYQPLKVTASWGNLEIVLYLRKIAGDKLKCNKCIVAATCMKICKDFVNDK